MTPCGLVYKYQCVQETHCFSLQGTNILFSSLPRRLYGDDGAAFLYSILNNL